jgi:hypothetical protein
VKYRLYTYDLLGNAKDGFEVNDVYRTSTVIEVQDDTSDRAINRRIGGRGIVWDGEAGYTLYGETKTGKPVCELRAEWIKA